MTRLGLISMGVDYDRSLSKTVMSGPGRLADRHAAPVGIQEHPDRMFVEIHGSHPWSLRKANSQKSVASTLSCEAIPSRALRSTLFRPSKQTFPLPLDNLSIT